YAGCRPFQRREAGLSMSKESNCLGLGSMALGWRRAPPPPLPPPSRGRVNFGRSRGRGRGSSDDPLPPCGEDWGGGYVARGAAVIRTASPRINQALEEARWNIGTPAAACLTTETMALRGGSS